MNTVMASGKRQLVVEKSDDESESSSDEDEDSSDDDSTTSDDDKSSDEKVDGQSELLLTPAFTLHNSAANHSLLVNSQLAAAK